MKLKEVGIEEALAIACCRPEPEEKKQRVFRLVEMTGCETGYDYNRTTMYFIDEGDKDD